jgi:hypothetical protein
LMTMPIDGYARERPRRGAVKSGDGVADRI